MLRITWEMVFKCRFSDTTLRFLFRSSQDGVGWSVSFPNVTWTSLSSHLYLLAVWFRAGHLDSLGLCFMCELRIKSMHRIIVIENKQDMVCVESSSHPTC